MKDLYSIKVSDRRSFIEFLHLLVAEYNTNKHQWENQDLGSFLEAMARYSEDIDGYYKNCEKELGERINPDMGTFRVFADILRGAIVYE
jgi:hypothetical protein